MSNTNQDEAPIDTEEVIRLAQEANRSMDEKVDLLMAYSTNPCETDEDMDERSVFVGGDEELRLVVNELSKRLKSQQRMKWFCTITLANCFVWVVIALIQ